MRLFKIDRSDGLLNATVVLADVGFVDECPEGTYVTLTQARNSLANELRVERDKWGDAIRRVEAINLHTLKEQSGATT